MAAATPSLEPTSLVRSDLDVPTAELHADMADLRSEMHRVFAARTHRSTGSVAALSAVVLAVARMLF